MKFLLNKRNQYWSGALIFFEKVNDQIKGTFALIKIKGTVYELAKIAMRENLQGKKI